MPGTAQDVAKHGYTVDWGMFNGVCAGSDAQPLERERTKLDDMCRALLVYSIDMDAAARRYGAHDAAMQPATLERTVRVYDRHPVCYAEEQIPWAECADHERASFWERNATECTRKAARAREHRVYMRKLATVIFGTEPKPMVRRELVEIVSGMRFELYGARWQVQSVDQLGGFRRARRATCSCESDGSRRPARIPLSTIRKAGPTL